MGVGQNKKVNALFFKNVGQILDLAIHVDRIIAGRFDHGETVAMKDHPLEGLPCWRLESIKILFVSVENIDFELLQAGDPPDQKTTVRQRLQIVQDDKTIRIGVYHPLFDRKGLGPRTKQFRDILPADFDRPMRLFNDRQRLRLQVLDEYFIFRVQRYIGFPTFPLHITLEQLLTHSAGLVPWHPFYLYQPLADLAQIAALKNMAAPGIRVLYSDVGYILLRRLLEKTVGLEFQKMAAAIIFKQLKLQNTFFLVPDAKKTRCAPTEIGNRYERNMCRSEHEEAAACFSWRTRLLRGEVHDANSFYSGGSALAKLAIGHNGFTGTSLWLEPETQR